MSDTTEKFDITCGVNPHQSVAGMVAEYEAKEAKKDAECYDPDATDVPKEEMEPSREGVEMVRKGRLNADTGVEIPPTSKTRACQIKQFGRVSPAYLRGYEAISWDGGRV